MEIVDQFRPTPFYRRFEGEILLNQMHFNYDTLDMPTTGGCGCWTAIIPYSQYTFNLKYLLLTKSSTLLSPFFNNKYIYPIPIGSFLSCKELVKYFRAFV